MANETLDQLEDAVLHALEPLSLGQTWTIPGSGLGPQAGYLRTRKAYQGELDVESADQINVQWPAALVFVEAITYIPVSTRGLEFSERPQLAIFVGDQNWRGEKEQRRGGPAGTSEVGTYRMIRNVRDILVGQALSVPGYGPLLDVGPLVLREVRSVLSLATPPLSIYRLNFEFADMSYVALGG